MDTATVFVPILVMALVTFSVGVLSGRWLWPRKIVVPGEAPANTETSVTTETPVTTETARSTGPTTSSSLQEPHPEPARLEPTLSDIEHRLRESEDELEAIRAAIRPAPDLDPPGAVGRRGRRVDLSALSAESADHTQPAG